MHGSHSLPLVLADVSPLSSLEVKHEAGRGRANAGSSVLNVSCETTQSSGVDPLQEAAGSREQVSLLHWFFGQAASFIFEFDA